MLALKQKLALKMVKITIIMKGMKIGCHLKITIFDLIQLHNYFC